MQADPPVGEKLGFDALQRTESSTNASSTKRGDWWLSAHAVKPRTFFFMSSSCFSHVPHHFSTLSRKFLFLLASYSICQGVRTDYECFFLRIKIFEENKREDIVTAMARHMWMTSNIASIQNMYLLYIFIQSGARNVIHFNIRVRFQEIVRQNKVIYGISFINNNFSGFCDAIYHDSYQFCE